MKSKEEEIRELEIREIAYWIWEFREELSIPNTPEDNWYSAEYIFKLVEWHRENKIDVLLTYY